MPKIVPTEQRMNIINLMLNGMGQRDIERETGLSRPYIRKLAKETGHVFPRNGVELKGILVMCANCSNLFFKPASRIERCNNNFCNSDCKLEFSKGENHSKWIDGRSVTSWSSWIKNQSSYEVFRKEVLKRDEYKCIVSGRTDNLHVHHIFQKAESFSPEKTLDPTNGISLNEEVHREIHKLAREGKTFDEAVSILKEQYAKKAILINK